MTKNDYSISDQVRELENNFEEALKKFDKKRSCNPIFQVGKKGCSAYVHPQNGGYYDLDALLKFGRECIENGYFAYLEKPSWAYTTMQELSVYCTRQTLTENRQSI